MSSDEFTAWSLPRRGIYIFKFDCWFLLFDLLFDKSTLFFDYYLKLIFVCFLTGFLTESTLFCELLRLSYSIGFTIN